LDSDRPDALAARLADGGGEAQLTDVWALLGTDDLSPMIVNWALSQILCYLRYLELREEVAPLDERDGAVPWARCA
jgi:hypothetical protein